MRGSCSTGFTAALDRLLEPIDEIADAANVIDEAIGDILWQPTANCRCAHVTFQLVR